MAHNITDEEITRLAREYAEYACPIDYYVESIPLDMDDSYERKGDMMVVEMQVEEFMKWLLRSHCLVEKSRIKEFYDDVCDDIADYKGEGLYGLSTADPTMCERAKGQKQMLRRLFADALIAELDKK